MAPQDTEGVHAEEFDEEDKFYMTFYIVKAIEELTGEVRKMREMFEKNSK